MQITRIGTVPSYKGPEEWFTIPLYLKGNFTFYRGSLNI
jgi:hypothetical protein